MGLAGGRRHHRPLIVELVAVAVMILVGGVAAVLVVVAVSIARGGEAPEHAAAAAAADRDRVAGSILYQVLISGGVSSDEALRQLRRTAGIASRITPSVDLTSWGGTFARASSAEQRARLLETAVILAAAPKKPIPLRQYCALLDLSFALGFQTDALARLRDQYGFDYVDHARHARPREADRAGGATPFFVRQEGDIRELLLVLEIEDKYDSPSRQAIMAAYRRLASMNHPDRFFDRGVEAQETAAARFIEITRAYEKLMAIFRD